MNRAEQEKLFQSAADILYEESGPTDVAFEAGVDVMAKAKRQDYINDVIVPLLLYALGVLLIVGLIVLILYLLGVIGHGKDKDEKEDENEDENEDEKEDEIEGF